MAGYSAVVISRERGTIKGFFLFTPALITSVKLLTMADLKRRTLLLSTGKQIKLFGTSSKIFNRDAVR